ncbi:DUF4129 domain-containing protein [Cellulomonas sp. ICMP 17802]|uniref:DUF4129 domain-containing protein n=1 Tax=Cellulomonas sp. ICMP 17802 TaxID=3239199 RepID=UPI00351ADCB6
MATQARRPSAALLVGAFVVVAVLGAALAGPFRPRLRGGPAGAFEVPTFTAGNNSSTPLPASTDAANQLPPGAEKWFYLLILLVIGAILLVGVWVLGNWIHRFRERRAPVETDDAEPDVELTGDVQDGATPALREGVRRAAQVLDDEVPPGDAVIAAWVALEEAAGRSGLVRDRAETATEFTVEVLDATRADPGATRHLLELYLAARYSQHALTREDVVEARQSLAAIADDLARRGDDA